MGRISSGSAVHLSPDTVSALGIAGASAVEGEGMGAHGTARDAAAAMAATATTAAVAAADSETYPMLYRCESAPAWEHMSMYESEDLEPSELFVLVSEACAYIFVGAECTPPFEGGSSADDAALCANLVSLGKWGLSERELKVVREARDDGSALWSEFLDVFAEGM